MSMNAVVTSILPWSTCLLLTHSCKPKETLNWAIVSKVDSLLAWSILHYCCLVQWATRQQLLVCWIFLNLFICLSTSTISNCYRNQKLSLVAYPLVYCSPNHYFAYLDTQFGLPAIERCHTCKRYHCQVGFCLCLHFHGCKCRSSYAILFCMHFAFSAIVLTEIVSYYFLYLMNAFDIMCNKVFSVIWRTIGVDY